MAKKKFTKAIAEIPEKPLVYGGNDMHNEKWYEVTGKKPKPKPKPKEGNE